MANLSDTEIIKFLECCSSNDMDSCLSCPLYISDTLCENMPFKEILDLINRLKAENEEKDILFEASKMTNEILGTATESFKLQLERALKQLKTAKSEARKEFAEAYKDQIKNYTGMFTDEGFYVSLDAILNAVDFVFEKLQKETG